MPRSSWPRLIKHAAVGGPRLGWHSGSVITTQQERSRSMLCGEVHSSGPENQLRRTLDASPWPVILETPRHLHHREPQKVSCQYRFTAWLRHRLLCPASRLGRSFADKTTKHGMSWGGSANEQTSKCTAAFSRSSTFKLLLSPRHIPRRTHCSRHRYTPLSWTVKSSTNIQVSLISRTCHRHNIYVEVRLRG